MKHLGVHGHFRQGEVVYTFVEPLMVSIFHALCSRVNTYHVLKRCIGLVAKVVTFLGIDLVLSFTFHSRVANVSAAPEHLDIG